MNKQPEALRLADKLDYFRQYELSSVDTGIDEQAAAELRRQHALIKEIAFHLLAAANYVDALGGVSNSYRQIIAKAEAQS